MILIFLKLCFIQDKYQKINFSVCLKFIKNFLCYFNVHKYKPSIANSSYWDIDAWLGAGELLLSTSLRPSGVNVCPISLGFLTRPDPPKPDASLFPEGTPSFLGVGTFAESASELPGLLCLPRAIKSPGGAICAIKQNIYFSKINKLMSVSYALAHCCNISQMLPHGCILNT